MQLLYYDRYEPSPWLSDIGDNDSPRSTLHTCQIYFINIHIFTLYAHPCKLLYILWTSLYLNIGKYSISQLLLLPKTFDTKNWHAYGQCFLERRPGYYKGSVIGGIIFGSSEEMFLSSGSDWFTRSGMSQSESVDIILMAYINQSKLEFHQIGQKMNSWRIVFEMARGRIHERFTADLN